VSLKTAQYDSLPERPPNPTRCEAPWGSPFVAKIQHSKGLTKVVKPAIMYTYTSKTGAENEITYRYAIHGELRRT
jgi:hypothetical protein